MREISKKTKRVIEKYRAMSNLVLAARKSVEDDSSLIYEYRDIRYSEYEEFGLLDVYRPVDYEGRLPVIIHTHGGAYCYGSKEIYRDYCKSLAKKGFAVVNYNYRLFYEYEFPAPIEDLNSVLGWVEKNSTEYSFDMEKVFLAGDSAGANNTFLYLVLRDSDRYKSCFFSKPSSVMIRGALLNCGFYGPVKNSSSDVLGINMIEEYFGGSEKVMRIVSEAMNLLDAGFPPCYVMTSNDDFVKKDSYELKSKLEQNSLKFVFKEYGTNEKRLKHVFHIDVTNESADICNGDECDFLKKL